MSPLRRGIVLLFLTVLVGGHLFDIVTFREHWPFSRYAMYAFVAQPQFSFYVLYGVRERITGYFPLPTGR